jgi:acyl-CoA thioesterase FadM
LQVHCRAGKIGNTSPRFGFQVFGEAGKREVAVGEIVVVIAERHTYQMTPVPDRLRETIEAYEGSED